MTGIESLFSALPAFEAPADPGFETADADIEPRLEDAGRVVSFAPLRLPLDVQDGMTVFWTIMDSGKLVSTWRPAGFSN